LPGLRRKITYTGIGFKKMDRPSLKISQTFIDFVKPLMPPIDENTTEEQIRTFFELGFTVWNAVLLDSVNKNDFYKKYLEELLSQNPGFDIFIKPLIERRKTLFANDKRMIGNFTVTYKDGNLNVRAEARGLPKQKMEK
jgi:hypothetical protein